MLKKYWAGILVTIIFLAALVIRIQEFFVKTPTVTPSNDIVLTTTTVNNDSDILPVETTTPIVQKPIATKNYYPYNTGGISFGELKMDILVADTPAARFKGLSDRQDLGDFGGMLFVFDSTAYYSMVMRDMLFSLDFIWLEGNTVVDFKTNAPPERGISENELTTYTNSIPASMVLEVPAGFVERNQIKVGEKVVIEK